MAEHRKTFWSGREASRELGVTLPRLLRRMRRLRIADRRVGGVLVIDAESLALLRSSFREADRLPA